MAKWLKSNTYKETILLHENGLKVCKTFVKLDIVVLRITMDNNFFNLKQLLKIMINWDI